MRDIVQGQKLPFLDSFREMVLSVVERLKPGLNHHHHHNQETALPDLEEEEEEAEQQEEEQQQQEENLDNRQYHLQPGQVLAATLTSGHVLVKVCPHPELSSV